jgi:hypothetical protein
VSVALERLHPVCPNCGCVCVPPELPSRYGAAKTFKALSLKEKIDWFAQFCECGAKFSARFYRHQTRDSEGRT